MTDDQVQALEKRIQALEVRLTLVRTLVKDEIRGLEATMVELGKEAQQLGKEDRYGTLIELAQAEGKETVCRVMVDRLKTLLVNTEPSEFSS